MTKKNRAPKPRNAEKSRAKILAAAQESFSKRGYSQAGIREIAGLADVSSTLLLRYFGSKAGLFEAALMDALQMEALFEFDKSEFGRLLADLLSNPRANLLPPSIVALSTGDDDARGIATRVTSEHVLKPLADWLGPPDGNVRALEIMMLGMGFVLFTHQFPLLVKSRAEEKSLTDWFLQSVQQIVDQK